MKVKATAAVLGAAFVFTGCASAPEKINATYVPDTLYESWSCERLEAEVLRTNHDLLETTELQRKKAKSDTAAVTVGVIVSPLALGFLATKDYEDQLARLKGEFKAMETTLIAKQCDATDILAKVYAQRTAANERHTLEMAQYTRNVQDEIH